jgi:broad specificity phosphatase PhoE
MKTLWLIRHAHRWDFVQPEWFETATYPYDPPLSPQGFEQAAKLVEKFSSIAIDRIYTSPFLRTIQTANPLARSLQLPIQLEWGLCEWLCQSWTSELPQTTPIHELVVDYPEIDATYQSLVVPCYPETIAELDTRITMLADKLSQDNNDQHLLVIAHKGSALGIAKALTAESRWQNYDLACGEMIKLTNLDGRWRSDLIDR